MSRYADDYDDYDDEPPKIEKGKIIVNGKEYETRRTFDDIWIVDAEGNHYTRESAMNVFLSHDSFESFLEHCALEENPTAAEVDDAM